MGGRPEWAGIPGTAYYNEIDPYAAQWLRNLIKAGHIAPGVVDERSIVDIIPEELNGFVQCHFFAGVGVWSHALRLAGWPDDRPVWTGSCPCQPFSAAGQGAGFADERHLWPAFHHLIRECRPAEILGEQVASSAVDAWIDLVHADLEALGYAFGSVPFPSAGVGAPHIRDRNYWMAHPNGAGSQGERGNAWQRESSRAPRSAQGGTAMRLGDSSRTGLDQCIGNPGVPGGSIAGPQGQTTERTSIYLGERPGPTNGFWRDADWLGCTDGKFRPVEARIQQVVDGHPARVGPLCARIQAEIEKAINEAEIRLQIQAGTLLREVRDATYTTGLFEWRGGIFSVHEAQVLLSYLFEHTGEERHQQNTDHGAGARSGPQNELRMLWWEGSPSHPSRERRLEGQSARELADAVRVLSSAVARFASEAGYQNLYQNANASFPLGEILYPDSVGVLRPKNRASRLKAYGNAINAEAARAFIECVMG